MKRRRRMAVSASFLLLSAYLFLLPISASAAVSLNATDPSLFACGIGKFLDINTLNCKSCGANQELYASSCRCQRGTFFNPTNKQCVACPAGQTSSADRLVCLTCPTGNPDPATMKCSCPANQILVDRNAQGNYLTAMICSACPVNSYPNDDITRCLACDDPAMVGTLSGGAYSCQCPSPTFSPAPQGNACLTASQASDLSASYSTSRAAMVVYSSLPSSSVTFSSLTIAIIFPAAVEKCKTYVSGVSDGSTGGPESCQALANLCVLHLYDDSAESCKAYLDIARSAKVNGGENKIADWPTSMPFLYYGIASGSKANVFTDSIISQSYGHGTGQSPALSLYAAVYHLNGTFMGFEKFVGQMQLCPRDQKVLPHFLTVGTVYNNTCEIELKATLDRMLAKRDQAVFYDLYVAQSDSTLLPVPLVVTNIPGNTAKDTTSYRLTRRFFSLDVSSGVDASGLRYIRYPSSVILQARLGDTAGTLTVPVLTVTYAERDVAGLVETDGTGKAGPTVSVLFECDSVINVVQTSTAQVTFQAIYTMSLEELWRGTMIVVAMLGMLAAVLWLYQNYAWSKRNFVRNASFDLRYIFRSICVLCGVLGPLLFILIFGISTYWTVFFKGQSIVYIMLPMAAMDVEGVKLAVMAGLAFETVHIVDRMIPQCTADVFFLDWEKSRGRLTNSAGSDELPRPAPVSMWRTVLMANVWGELQTHRKARMDVTLVTILLVMYGAGWRYIAMARPSVGMLEPEPVVPTHPLLSFCINTSVFGGIVLLQVMFRFLVYDRFYKHKPLQFIDLLSVSNVSVLVLLERYAGYYIHGRSVHAFADTDAEGMNENLKKEENDLVPKRGLQDTDIQVYEVHLTQPFRAMYDKIYSGVEAEREAQRLLDRRMPGKSGSAASHGRPRSVGSETVNSVATLNRFLTSWIDQNLKEYPYVIRRKTYLEKWFLGAPDLSQGCVFFEDSGSLSFTSSLLYGLESHITLFHILLFCYVDDMMGQTWLAVVAVYLADLLLAGLRGFFGARNVARKSVVDQRFLLL